MYHSFIKTRHVPYTCLFQTASAASHVRIVKWHIHIPALTTRAYFSVYYYTKCVLLKACRATLKTKMCNIKLVTQTIAHIICSVLGILRKNFTPECYKLVRIACKMLLLWATLKKIKKVIFSISCLRRFWDTAYSLEAHSEPSTRDHWNSWHVVGTLKVCFCRRRERLCEQYCTFLYTVASRPTRSSRERPPFETKSLSSAADSLFSRWI